MELMTLSLVVVLLLACPCLRCQDATFRVPEEQMNALVGSIPDGIHLKSILADETVRSLTYSFLTHGYPDSRLFTINRSTGELRTAGAVDREQVCGFQLECVLVIQVAIQSSSDQYFKKVKIHVVLEDINDNAPEFPTSEITLHISEDVSKNTSYSIDGAVDKDIGENGLKGYELISDDGPFFLQVSKRLDGGQTISLIIGEGLDRELRSLYTLKIKARDGGYPVRTGEITLNIVVSDINDNRPRFKSSFYNVTVKETELIHSVIFTVSATDADSEENGVDFYRFSSLQIGNFENYISINNKTGEVFVIADLEPVQGETFKFVVECVDKGVPPLVAQALVELNIEDSVNSPPRINFNLLSSGIVSEYAVPGTVVAHIAVHDPDYGNNGMIKCFLISNSFELDALGVNEYKVNLLRYLDREVEDVVNVTVTCEDSGSPPLNSSIDFSINVEDENDHAPYFLQEVYTAYLDENRKDVVITQVTAQDNDIGENGEIEYIIPYGWQIGLRVLPNGDIICNKSFDRESTPKIAVTIIARDRGKPQRNDSTTLIITINDVNDVTPAFYKQKFTFTMPENQPAGTTFGNVVAFDLDLRDGGELRYYLEPEDGLDIDISYDGLLKTTASLDREARDSYIFTVWVADGGTPALSSSATVIVNVTDENDNFPVIHFSGLTNHTLTIPQDTPAGTVVMSVEARDKDADMNGKCKFYILPENYEILDENDSQSVMEVMSMFDINTDTGDLMLKNPLTKEDIGYYQIRILVRDQGMPPLMSNLTLHIQVVLSNTSGNGGMNKENTVVVAVVGSLTGVVSVIVIITILLIKRRDRAKQKYSAPNLVTHPAPSNLKPVEDIETNSDGQDGRNRFDDEPDGSSRVFATEDESDEKRDDELFKDGVDLDEEKNQTWMLSEVERHWLADVKTIPDWSTALKLHQDLLRLHGVQTKVLSQTHYEDGHSECSEEVPTSDSGRGGSDEDSHGRASPECKHDDAIDKLINYKLHQAMGNNTINYITMKYDNVVSTPLNQTRKADIWTIDSNGSGPSTQPNSFHKTEVWTINKNGSIRSTRCNNYHDADIWKSDNNESVPSTPTNTYHKAEGWTYENNGSFRSTQCSKYRKSDTWNNDTSENVPSTPTNYRKSDTWNNDTSKNVPSTPTNNYCESDTWNNDSSGHVPSTPTNYRKSDTWKNDSNGHSPSTAVNSYRNAEDRMVDGNGSVPSTPTNYRNVDTWKIDNVPSTPTNCCNADTWKGDNNGSVPSTPTNCCRKADTWKNDNGSVPSTPTNCHRKPHIWQNENNGHVTSSVNDCGKGTMSSQEGYKKRYSNPVQKRVTFQRDTCLGSGYLPQELHHTMYDACIVVDDVSQSMDDDDTTTSGSYSVGIDHETIEAMMPRLQDMLV